jgi:hypothetical protein
MVEPIFMAVGTAIGVAGLYSTCLQAFEDYEAVRNFETDSQLQGDFFEAQIFLLKSWGRRVGIGNDMSQHPCLDARSEEYALVQRLLKHFQRIWSDADKLSRKYDMKLVGTAVKGGVGTRISLNPRMVSLGRKLVWASRDKAKFKRLLENLGQITLQLNDITSAGDHIKQIQYNGTNDTSQWCKLRVLIEGKVSRYLYPNIHLTNLVIMYRTKKDVPRFYWRNINDRSTE